MGAQKPHEAWISDRKLYNFIDATRAIAPGSSPGLAKEIVANSEGQLT